VTCGSTSLTDMTVGHISWDLFSQARPIVSSGDSFMCFGSAGVTSSRGVVIFPNDGQFQRFVSGNMKTMSIPQSITITGTFG